MTTSESADLSIVVTRLDRQRTELQRQVAELDQRIAAAVVELRAAGASWTEVGYSLNVSKQAAHERYGKPRV